MSDMAIRRKSPQEKKAIVDEIVVNEVDLAVGGVRRKNRRMCTDVLQSLPFSLRTCCLSILR
jgi:hypothetical protein